MAENNELPVYEYALPLQRNTIEGVVSVRDSVDRDNYEQLRLLELDRKYELVKTLFCNRDFKQVKNIDNEIKIILQQATTLYNAAYKEGITPRNGKYRK